MTECPPTKPKRRLVALFALLYFSEGAPIGFIWWALPTLLREEGLEVSRIAALMAALVLPWTLKFLWAPIVDAWCGPRWHRRHWIIAAQAGMGLALVPLVFLGPAESFPAWSVLLLTHAFFAATQDVAIDGLAVEIVPAGSRGWINGAMQAGMLLGRGLFGGVSILVVGRWGWAAVFVPLILAIWGTLLVVKFSSELSGGRWEGAARERKRRVFTALKKMLGRRVVWYAVAFALLGGAGFEAVGGLAGPYLLDTGAAADSVGMFFALPTVIAMLAGGLIGGRVSDRVGRERAVGMFLALIVVCVLLLAVIGDGASPSGRFGVLAILYGGIGMFTASSYALFMDLADPEAGGTQFSAFMAATNACEAWTVWTAGRLTANFGYSTAFVVMAMISIIGAMLLVPIRRCRLPQRP